MYLVIIDRTTGIGQSILMNARKARIGIVIHADHFSENYTNDNFILWNNYYEYAFSMNKHIDFYISATEEQNKLLKMQFEKYKEKKISVYTIPVGSLNCLKQSKIGRRPFSLITASRLANEKHVDWIVKAVISAKKEIPELSLDIFGQGIEKSNIDKLIKENHACDYIKLMGQKDLSNIYENYEGYISASTSEGFGLTLMEAVGSGLPIIGFDVRYGNPTFIDDGKNGYLIPIQNLESENKKIEALSDKICELFSGKNLEEFHKNSYEIAENYLTEVVQQKWRKLLHDKR